MAEGGLGMTIVPELILKGIGGNRAAVELEPACTRTIGIAERSIGTGSLRMRSIYALHGELGQKEFGGCDSMTNAEKQRIRSFQNGAAML